MPTPLRPWFVTLGGLMWGSRALWIYDWSQLTGASDKAGDDLDIPGRDGHLVQDGANDEPRYQPPHYANLQARIDGRWTQDNEPHPGGRDDWVDHYYELLAETTTTRYSLGIQTVTLTGPGGPIVSEDCIVESPGIPQQIVPWRYALTIGVKLPDGPPTILTAGS